MATCDLAVVQAARDGKKHHRHNSDSSTSIQESTTMLLLISSNSKGEYKDGDLYYPVGAINQLLFGSHMCVRGLEEVPGRHI